MTLNKNKTFLCTPVSSNSHKTLTGSSSINFEDFVNDFEEITSKLRIKLVSLPTKGIIKISNFSERDEVMIFNADLDTPYEINSFIYTSNESECMNNYTDIFEYKVVNTNKLESTTSIANINANLFNCTPTATNFNKSISENLTIDFTNFIKDKEDPNTSLKIKFATLPSIGTLTISDTQATIDTEYPRNAIVYKISENQCSLTKYYSESFNWKVIDTSNTESEQANIDIVVICRPSALNFKKIVQDFTTISFADYISDLKYDDSELKISITSSPTRGFLTAFGDNVDLNTSYGIDDINYTLNQQVSNNCHDNFNYRVIDSENTKSKEANVKMV